ncbi:hypothetical protein Tco_0575878 [Tanacetum coccineum]
MESNEVINSSVEDLVPILRKFVTFSNPLFDSNDDFTSSDDESLSYKDVLEDNVKIYSNPLFEFDDEYISSDVNPLFDEVLEDIERGKINEIDAFLDMDIENVYHDSEEDIIYLVSLLINDIIPNLLPKVFLDHDPKNLKDEPDNKDLKSMVKVFDPEIHEKTFSPTYVRLPFEDRHYLSLTYVIRIFLPYFNYLVDSFLLLSFGSEDTILTTASPFLVVIL